MDPTDLVLLAPTDRVSFEAPHNHEGSLELLVTPVGVNHPRMMPKRVKRDSHDDTWANKQFGQKVQSVAKDKKPTAKDLKANLCF